MSDPAPAPDLSRTHRLKPMTGRDPHEGGRVATPLELLYDLVFVVAFGQAGNEFAHRVAEGHLAAGIGAFLLAMFAIVWAWVNFSWFASAFDTDDWAHRLATMVQMVGATILALGLPAVFRSIDAGEGLDINVMVGGYVVMRLAMIAQWVRAARASPRHRTACLTYAVTIAVAQLGWVVLAMAALPLGTALVLGLGLILIELAGPILAETRGGGTPWHAHHITERYSLLAIITLGEGVIGTVASLTAVVEAQGWSLDAVLIAVAGLGLTFGMWWAYFLVSAGDILHARRERVYRWAYGGMPIFAAIAAMGAGLHVAALHIEGHAAIGPVTVVLALAIPVGLYLATLYGIYAVLYDEPHPLRTRLLLLTAAILVAAPVLTAFGLPVPWALIVVMAAPAVTVIGYEVYGHQQVTEALGRVLGRA